MRQIGGDTQGRNKRLNAMYNNLPQKHLYYTTLLTKEKQFFCKRVRKTTISNRNQKLKIFML